MNQSGVTVRNFVSETLLRAFEDRELDLSQAIDSIERNILNELVQNIGCEFIVSVEKGIQDVEADVIADDVAGAFFESDLFQDMLVSELKDALYDAQQAAKEAFRNYLATKADTQDLANELVSYVERNQ